MRRLSLAAVALAVCVAAPVLADEPVVVGWKIWVQKPGLYKIPTSDLPRGGVGCAKGDEDFVLTSRGEQIAFLQSGSDLFFWGEPDWSTRDARGRCYHLASAKETKGRRIGTKTVAAPQPTKDAERAAFTTVLPEESRQYDPLIAVDGPSLSPVTREGGYWFFAGDGEAFERGRDNGAVHLSFATGRHEPFEHGNARAAAVLHLGGIFVERMHAEPLPSGGSIKQLGLAAGSTPGKLTVKVGDEKLTVDVAKQGASIEVALPENTLRSTTPITISAVGGRVLVQRASLRYRQILIAAQELNAAPNVELDPLHRSRVFLGSGATIELGPVPAEAVLADLDTGELLELARAGTHAFAKTTKGHRIGYFLPRMTPVRGRNIEPIPGATLAGNSVPVAISVCLSNDLLEEKGADWVAIAPRFVADALEPLARHREKQGLSTKIVALEDVEDVFGDGSYGPESVRAFLAHAKARWKPAPRFVLLGGDAWRDFRPNDGAAWVPTGLADTFENGGSATDGSLAPEGVAIGRFPCRTREELSSLVAKTIEYEAAPAGEWQKQLSFVCGEGRFGPLVDGMIEDLFTKAVGKRVPASYDVDVTYGNPTSIFFFPPEKFSDRVVERLSAGALIFDYVGHGAPGALDDVHWGRKRYPILRREDAARVRVEGSKYPVVLITACWTGCYDRNERTVGEELVLNPKGAVAVFAASRISHPFANALLSLELTQKLFEKAGDVPLAERPRLGERLTSALAGLSLSSGGTEGKTVVGFARMMMQDQELPERLIKDERNLYNLLGDPALVLRHPEVAKLAAPDRATPGEVVSVGAIPEGATLVLERVRGPAPGLAGLDGSVKPEALEDPALRDKVVATYRKANEFVLARGEGGRIQLPAQLAPGKYVLKVYAARERGIVGSSLIEVVAGKPAARPDESPAPKPAEPDGKPAPQRRYF